MKKLKVVLFVLFAAVLTAGLCACKGKGNKQEIASITESRQTVLKLTDSDGEAEFNAAIAKYVVNVVYKNSDRDTITGDKCTVAYAENIRYGEVGSYYIVVKPKDNNPDNVYVRVQVDVQHAWGSAQNGVRTCSHCNAMFSETTLESPETLTFNDFHVDDKEFAGGTIIKEFGSVNVKGRPVKVSSFTVGRLEKGGSITVKGTAKANSNAKAYYFPIIGFADTSLGEYDAGGTYQGTSIFVRNEGWTLTNGVGSPRMLAAIAGGTTESRNYGSHFTDSKEDEIKNRPQGYDAWKSTYNNTEYARITRGIPMKAEEYAEWAAYTEGTALRTEDYYLEDGLAIEMTWTYRNDGIIELTIANPDLGTSLVARVRVPDNEQGYYDTIIHGDYMTYQIDGASYVTPRTLDSIAATADTSKEYLANTKLAFADVTVKAKYEQTGNEEFNATGFDVYGFVPSANGADAVEETKGTYYDLSVYPLQAGMTHFKVVYTVGPNAKETVIAKENFVKVIGNSVSEVISYPVQKGQVAFAGSLIDSAALSVATAETVKQTKIALTGMAGTLTAAQKEALGTTANKYVALRLLTNENGTAFLAAEPAAGAVWFSVAQDRSYVDVIIAVGSEKTYTVTGLQETPIVFDITNVQGIAVNSAVSGAQNLFLNAEGTFTLQYNFEAGTLTGSERIAVETPWGQNLLRLRKDSEAVGLTITEITDGTTSLGEDFENWASLTKLTLTIKKDAVKLGANSAFGSYVLKLNRGETTLSYDEIKLQRSFSNAQGASGFVLDAEGKVLADVNGNTLFVAYIVSENENIRATDVGVRNFMLNFNAGTQQTIKLVNLAGTYFDYSGKFTLADTDLTEESVVTTSVYVDGTVGNANDVDYVAVVVYSIDLEAIGSGAEKLFDLVGGAEGSYYKIAGGAMEVVAYDAEKFTTALISENSGDCYDGALVARTITDTQNKPVFLAGAHYVGGDHLDANGDKKCDLCGASLEEKEINTAWFGKSDNVSLGVGQIYDYYGTFKEKSGADGRMTVAIQELYSGGYNLYRLDGSGWGTVLIGCTSTWDSKTGEYNPYYVLPEGSDLEGTTGSEDFTRFKTSNPFNSVLGTQAKDGSGEITDEKLQEVLDAGATFRYTITNDGSIVTVRMRLFRSTDFNQAPYYDYSFTIENTDNFTYKFDFTGFEGKGEIEGKVVKATGRLVNSMLTSGAGATVEGYTSSNITLGSPAFDGAQAKIAVSGMADKVSTAGALGDNDYYVAFSLAFSGKLVDSTSANVVDAAGNVLERAVAKYDAATGKLLVLVPLNSASALEECKLVLSNLHASTAQCDIVVDLTGVIMSDYEVQLTNNLNLTGGTITYSVYGTVADEMKIAIGGAEKAISAVANGATFETANGTFTVTSVNKTAAAYTLTLALSDLNYAKKLIAYEVKLLSPSDAMLASNTVDPVQLPTSGAVFEGVLAVANGGKLTLLVTTGLSDGATKDLTLNANNGNKNAYLRNWNIGFKIDGEAAKFAEWNSVTKAAGIVYTDLGAHKVAAIALDLTAIGLGETIYGFEAYVGAATVPVLYSVQGTTLTALSAGEGAAVEVQAASCTQGAITAKSIAIGSGTFYYNVAVGATVDHVFGTEGADGYAVCANCGALKKAGAVAASTKVAADKLANITKNGLTVSFLGNTASDWNAILTTGEGDVRITFPNIDPNFGVVPENCDLSTELQNLIKALQNTNCFPSINGSTVGSFSATPWNNMEAYATVVVSPSEGVKYYYNGELAIYYKPSDKLGNGRTIDEFVQVFLALTQRYGLILNGGNITVMKDAIVQPVAITAQMAKERYDFYVEEQNRHEHQYDPVTDRCPDDNELNPNHGKEGGLPHKWDATDHCEICDILNPDHNHEFTNSVCVCGAMEVSYPNGDVTFTGVLEKIDDFKNNDPDGAWWNGGSTDDIVMNGDTMAVITWENTRDKGFFDYAIEVQFNFGGTQGDGHFIDFDPTNQWSAEYVSGTAPTLSGTTTGEQGTPAAGTTVGYGTYKATVVRIDATLYVTVEFTANGSDTVTWTRSAKAENVETGEYHVRVAGNPFFLDNFKAWSGSISQAPTTAD